MKLTSIFSAVLIASLLATGCSTTDGPNDSCENGKCDEAGNTPAAQQGDCLTLVQQWLNRTWRKTRATGRQAQATAADNTKGLVKYLRNFDVPSCATSNFATDYEVVKAERDKWRPMATQVVNFALTLAEEIGPEDPVFKKLFADLVESRPKVSSHSYEYHTYTALRLLVQLGDFAQARPSDTEILLAVSNWRPCFHQAQDYAIAEEDFELARDDLSTAMSVSLSPRMCEDGR